MDSNRIALKELILAVINTDDSRLRGVLNFGNSLQAGVL